MVSFRPKYRTSQLKLADDPVPFLGLELTIPVIKSQIHLVRQSL